MFLFDALLAAGFALQSAPATRASAPVIPAVVVAPAAIQAPPSPDEVMVIPDGLRADFRRQVLDVVNAPEQRLRRMVAFMFDKDGLGLKYKADATNTVAESYRTRQVNCLSFTLMAVALAREAGLKAEGQQIDRVLAWNLTNDVVMQSLHANAVITIGGRDFMVDIASSRLYGAVIDYKVDDRQLLASFYGNRAMELMASGHAAYATPWLDEAMKLKPEDATFWNNAGVLAQRLGDKAAAESWFLRAARQNPRLMSVYYNLVALYHARGDSTRAAFWQERADKILRYDPYYQFSLGERNVQTGDYADAVRYYRRAISLDGREQLFHFGLARAYARLGRMDAAEDELGTAYRLSGGSDDRRFQAKLDALRSMAVR
jgi:Flp pilus assembly protein TadD